MLLASMLPVAVNCAGSYLSMALVDEGRRRALLTSLAASTATIALTSLAFALDAGGLLIVFLLSAFVFAYSLGLGSVPWLCSELFAPEIRAGATGMCTAANWAANMLFTQVFAMVPPALGFALIAGCSAVLGFPLVGEFPETAGKTMEEAAAQFT